MNSFLQSVRSAYSNKETLIKQTITNQLSDSVKEIQLCGMDENLSGDSMDIGDACSTLCSIIEAMFLHGLKDSLAMRARNIVTNASVQDHRPEPSFWSCLLIFSHRQIIDQIIALANITTEIGQCRAWVRFALNDSLLSSYLSTIRQNSEALKPFYKTHAYIRDAELVDVAQRLVEGVETFSTFALPCNSSLLNSWSLPTLLLAGIWSPPLRQCPITSGVDVAQSLTTTESSSLSSVSVSVEASPLANNSNSSELGKMVALNEDEALKIILSNTTTAPESCIRISEQEQEIQYLETRSSGNSLNRKSGWSFDQDVNHGDTHKTDEDDETAVAPTSYHALIESYNMMSNIKVPTTAPALASSAPETESQREATPPEPPEDGGLESENMGFELVTASSLEINETRTYISLIGKLALEKGLDVQNYECFGCRHPLSINVCKPRVCAYTGNCFCDSCMSPEPVMIPARIVHNWDFKQYYISKHVATFLNDIKDQPLLDLKVSNPYIYVGVEEMVRLQRLRVQLNFLRDYLYTCREPVIEQLQRIVWPKEYMYEHIHQYSVSDLAEIPGGVLAQTLQKVVSFGRAHVIGCWLCSQKGFICEVCNKPKVLYPFDVETTYRCEVCNAVYHNECLASNKPCPKCERRRKREDLSLLDATLDNDK